MKRSWIVCLTVLLWTVGCSVYGYYWVSGIMADPARHDYEGIWTLPLLGFLINKGPLLFVGLIGLIALELMLIPARQKELN